MESDSALAARLARRAAELLIQLRAEAERDGVDAAGTGRIGDLQSNELLLDGLDEARPDDLVLSEESVDDPARLDAERVWIVDPLDGTREYSQPGRDDWAVHVALWTRSAGLVAGAVALPAMDQVLGDDPPAVVPERADRRLRVVVSESRAPAWVPALAHRLDLEIVPMGSAGAKAMAVVRGEADAYVHSGGQYEWDSAAPVRVALAAGLHASRLDGAPLVYNLPDPYLPDLVICRAELAGGVLAALGEVGAR